jgi:alkanesulfonate monooxygenase SsuD/methylene tetrahydromethanopterin reductase-like flavin-dependent oxidoreductase (luciferase family)
MPTGVLVPEGHDDVPAFAERAERLGYDSLWVPELWGSDAFVALTRAARVTSDLSLGTAIVNAYGRSPATLAQAAASLTADADAGVRLGIGTSTRKVIEDLHGQSFENPPRRLHETVELTSRFLTADGRVSYEGKIFDVADFPGLGTDVPVYAAALGPSNRRATGRTADGWLPHNIPFGRLDEAFETIAETAREAGRNPDDITVAPYVPAAVSDDGEEAIQAARGHIAYYVGSGEGYRRAVAQSHPDGADAVAKAWREGERGEARAAVTEEMVADLAVAGTPADAREQFEEIAALDVIDEPLVVVPDGADEAIVEQTVAALAPERR